MNNNKQEFANAIWESEPASISNFDNEFQGLMSDIFYTLNPDYNDRPVETPEWILVAHYIRCFIAYKYGTDCLNFD